MKIIDIKVLAQHENQYIALLHDRSKIIASGKSIKEVEKKLKNIKVKDITLEFVTPLKSYLSP